MSEDSFTDGLLKARPVLGDLTNRPIKRAFSSLLGDSKSEDSQSKKRLIKGTSVAESGTIECSETETDSSHENSEFRVLNREASRDSSFSSVPIENFSEFLNSEAWRGWDEDRRRVSDASVTQSKCAERPSSKLAKESEESRGFEKCITIGGDDDDVLKGCSCAFCLKAAYIWSDLHYQDIKGRLSALKKSKKEANTLAQRNCKGNRIDLHGQGNPTKPSKLESDLNDHWKSLFAHMENVLVNESNQLQASFLALKELRENCKTDLKMINGIPSVKQ